MTREAWFHGRLGMVLLTCGLCLVGLCFTGCGGDEEGEAEPPEKVVEPVLCTPAGHPPLVEGTFAVFGPGADIHIDILRETGASPRKAPAGVAAAAGFLAFHEHAATGEETVNLSPMYIRPPDAVLKSGSGSGSG